MRFMNLNLQVIKLCKADTRSWPSSDYVSLFFYSGFINHKYVESLKNDLKLKVLSL